MYTQQPKPLMAGDSTWARVVNFLFPQDVSSAAQMMNPLGMEIPGGMPKNIGGSLEKLLADAWAKVPAGAELRPALQDISRGIASYGAPGSETANGIIFKLLNKLPKP